PGGRRGAEGRAQGGRGVPHGQGRGLARARPRPLRGDGALLPPELRDAPGERVDPRPRGRGGEARGGRARGGRRLRARRVHHSHGRGLPQLDLRRLRLPRAVDLLGAQGGVAGRRRRPGVLRGGVVEGVSRQGLRPGRVLRLPARHGRSRRRGEARALHARSGRDVDDRRAVRRRRRRAEPQPGGARLLLGLDHDLHARLARAGGGSRARGAGGRGEAAGGRDRGRLHALPPRDRDPLQPGARGATVAQTWDPERYARTARFVSELRGALARQGVDERRIQPWYFPGDDEYRARLAARGFVVRSIALIPRPTPLPGDVGEWLETFAQPFLDAAPDRTALLDAVRAELRPHLCGA